MFSLTFHDFWVRTTNASKKVPIRFTIRSGVGYIFFVAFLAIVLKIQDSFRKTLTKLSNLTAMMTSAVLSIDLTKTFTEVAS